MATKLIGTGGDYPPTAVGIHEALSAGHRHLLIIDDSVSMNREINLNSYPNVGQLVIEGAGWGMTNLNMDADFAAPVFSGGAGWDILLKGLHVRGAKLKNFAWTGPCCRFTDFNYLEINNSQFEDSKGQGLLIERSPGSGAAANAKLVNARFELNVGNGLVASYVGVLDMLAGTVQNNHAGGVGAGVHVIGAASGSTLRGVHFEQNGYNYEWGVLAEALAGLRILDCYLFASGIRLAEDTSNCLVENNARWSSPRDDDGSGNSFDVLLNPEINVP